MSSVAPFVPQTYRLDVEALTRMVVAGIVAEDARVELIDGELIDMPPINAPHSGAVNFLTRMFVLAAGDAAVVSIQNALRVSDFNLPQPDLTLLKAHPQLYSTRLPTARDVLLVIEVSDSTLKYDREKKLPMYALHKVPEVWIVDVNGRQVLRHRDPVSDYYQLIDTISGFNAPQALPECGVDLDRLFPD